MRWTPPARAHLDTTTTALTRDSRSADLPIGRNAHAVRSGPNWSSGAPVVVSRCQMRPARTRAGQKCFTRWIILRTAECLAFLSRSNSGRTGTAIQTLPDGSRQRLWREWLGQKGKAAGGIKLLPGDFRVIPADQQDLQLWFLGAQFCRQLPAADTIGHHDVRQQQIELTPVVVPDLERSRAGRRFHNSVAKTLQHHLDQLAQLPFIFGDQNSFRAAANGAVERAGFARG